MTERTPDAPFTLADWQVYPRLNRLRRGDQTVPVEPRVMAVLEALAARAGALASRRELLDAAWPDSVVGEEQLTRAISELRRLLDDNARRPTYIETIHTRGYRLLPPVTAVVTESPTDGPHEASDQSHGGRFHQRTIWGTAIVTVGMLLIAAWLASQRARPSEHRALAPHVAPLTTYSGREIEPAVSPDGSRIVFGWAGDPPTDGLDLWLLPRQGGTPTRLTHLPGNERMPAWSHDGASISFASFADGECRLAEIAAVGGPVRTLARCTQSMVGFDRSPDLLSLVVADRLGDDPRHGLVLLDLASGVGRALTYPPQQWQLDTSPRFAPDGSRVAFRRTLGMGTWEVFEVALDGGEPRPLTTDHQDNGGFAWFGDDGAIVYSSNRGGTFGLWLTPARDGEPRWLGIENAFRPSASFDGGVIAVERRRWDADIRRVRLDAAASPDGDETGEIWLGATRADLDPAYSPDGSQVAFVSWRTAGHELWVADAGGHGPRRLTFFDQPAPAWSPAVQHPRWSHDGRSLLIAARVGGGFDIYRTDIEGGPPRRLTDDAGDDLAPAWLGDRVVFASNRSGDWQLWMLAESGPPRLVTRTPIARFVDTVGVLVVVGRGQHELWLIDPVDGSERLVYDHPTGGRWTTTERSIVILASNRMIELDPVTGRSLREVAIPGLAPAGGLTVAAAGLTLSPDGSTLLYSRLESNESDIDLITGLSASSGHAP